MEKELISSMESNTKGFDYSAIPLGYYDHIANEKKGMRSFWHYLKFKRLIDGFTGNEKSILDIGCFAGTFLGMVPSWKIPVQVGVDILPDQIDYATTKYGTEFRKFYTLEEFISLKGQQKNCFDIVTLVEVIEHLTTEEIQQIFDFAYQMLKPEGKLIITTPNYFSLWPFLEYILNKISDVSYEEQHITRFKYFNAVAKLRSILPDFDKNFYLDYKTTTHAFTPFLATISFGLAEKISTAISPGKWKMPLGSILIIQLYKKL